MAAILNFSLIAGLGNVYPHYFLPSGDVVTPNQSFAVHIKVHTGPLSALGL